MTLSNPIHRKKTILIVTERFYPEEFRINDLAIAWVKKGYDVQVLTQVPSYPFGKVFKNYKNLIFQTELWDGVTINRIKTVTGYESNILKKFLHYLNFIIFGSIFALTIGRKIDKIFVYHLGPLTDAIPAIVIKKIFKKTITIWTTDIWPDAVFAFGIKRTRFRETILKEFVKFVYRNCENIVVSSQSFVDKLKKNVSGKKIHFIPYWADESNPNPKINSNNLNLFAKNKFQITYAGNIGKVQNLEKVILGFALCKSLDSIQLNFIGDGRNLENLKKMVVDNKFQNIVFWGRKPSRDMYKYFELSTI